MWLKAHGLDDYANIFKDQGVDKFALLRELDDNALKGRLLAIL